MVNKSMILKKRKEHEILPKIIMIMIIFVAVTELLRDFEGLLDPRICLKNYIK